MFFHKYYTFMQNMFFFVDKIVPMYLGRFKRQMLHLHTGKYINGIRRFLLFFLS